MTDETLSAIYDALLGPEWRTAKLVSGNRRVRAPYREDRDPSLDVHEGKLTWYDRATGEGGGAMDLGRKMLGEEGTRDLLRQLGNGEAPHPTLRNGWKRPPDPAKPPPPVEDLGELTSAQRGRLRRARRIRLDDTPEALEMRRVRVWGEEWIGLPALAGSWKLFGMNSNGYPRLDDRGRWEKRNAGSGSIVATPALRMGDMAGGPVRLLDVEGEGDLIACFETGFQHVVCSTTGAGNVSGHERNRDFLAALPVVEVIVFGDRDEAGERGASQRAAWWLSLGRPVRVPTLPEDLGDGGDLRDLLNGRAANGGTPGLEPRTAAELECLIAATPLRHPEREKPETADGQASRSSQHDAATETKLQELAQLSRIEYDRRRTSEAEALGVRAATLDAEVSARRPAEASEAEGGSDLLFPELEPWPAPIDGCTLLDALTAEYSRFLALPEHAAAAMALWTLHTHAFDAFDTSPVLAFSSPVPRCGKSSAQSLLQRTVPRPLPASSITAAALFRAVERWQPTLLIDEADTFLKSSDELRGILNSGHTRAQAKVIRTTGDDHEPRVFRTWAPKSIACIGKLPATLEDRAISVQMRRRLPGEKVERLRGAWSYGFGELARQCARWAADHLPALREADPGVPDSLHDRAADNWRPLLAIADAAGGDWPEKARRAAEGLTAGGEDESLGIRLLEDVRTVFGTADFISSHDLREALLALADRPWGEVGQKGGAITGHWLARRLKPFGVSPTQRKMEGIATRGYTFDDFAEAFERYLPAQPLDPPTQSGTAGPLNENGHLQDFKVGPAISAVPLSNPPNHVETKGSPAGPTLNRGDSHAETDAADEEVFV